MDTLIQKMPKINMKSKVENTSDTQWKGIYDIRKTRVVDKTTSTNNK